MEVSASVNIKIRDKKEVYRRRLENKQQNNVLDVSSGIKMITDFKKKEDQIDESLDRENELNSFFNRFSSEITPASSSPAPRKQTSLFL